MSRPPCQSDAVTRDSTTPLGGQRFHCSSCGRRFTRRSSSGFPGHGLADDIIALAVRWYVHHRLSYAEISQWLAERGISPRARCRPVRTCRAPGHVVAAALMYGW